MDPIADLQQQIASRQNPERAFVTLSYAQSLDGSVAVRPTEQLAISGPESLRLTHRLRAAHDAIMVGIGTILADDPALTVRHAEGSQPQPIVLDSYLTIPDNARILNHPRPPIIVTSEDAPVRRAEMLAEQDFIVLPLSANADEGIDLAEMLSILPQMGIHSVMVEGGVRVLTSFLRHKLADWALVTIAPYFVGGVHAIAEPVASVPSPADISAFPKLETWQSDTFGQDLVVWGKPQWA